MSISRAKVLSRMCFVTGNSTQKIVFRNFTEFAFLIIII